MQGGGGCPLRMLEKEIASARNLQLIAHLISFLGSEDINAIWERFQLLMERGDHAFLFSRFISLRWRNPPFTGVTLCLTSAFPLHLGKSQVHNEGGVMFAGLAEKAWGGADERAAEAAYELAWEELHGAPWQSVSLVWRDAFSLSCLSLASCHHNANRPIEALKILDLGVIMGGPQFRTELENALHSISSVTGTDNVIGQCLELHIECPLRSHSVVVLC
nr:uncharacterized protein LOC112279929 isoform X2 [Physcomitrium patens]|eukprot:XP_024370487.1 uncharacterized protein LOC112279929 isoform X2 [Physcomitrella patens]